MNKYQSTIDSSYNDRCGSLDSALVRDLERCDSIDSEQASRESVFFSDDRYREHSKQLVDALSEWAKQIKFVSYDYKPSELWEYNKAVVKPIVPYMDRMQEHLDAAYKDSFPDFDLDFIQSERLKICQEMVKLMTTPSVSTPHSPTFETIITNRIHNKCRHLRTIETTDPDPDTFDFYLRQTIFQIIFDVVEKKRQLNLKVKPVFQNNIHELMYGGASTIARGDEQSMTDLKLILEELVADTEIRSFVTRYDELKKKLDNDPNLARFRNVVSQFREFIYGGQVLGVPGSCKLCTGSEFKTK